MTCQSTLPGRAPGVDQCIKTADGHRSHECYTSQSARGPFVGLKICWIDPLSEPEED